ncbi:MAG: histidine kinase [Acidobacteria bacterium]|nr:histidine kinase [Acidobacteriota bacterium]
MKWGIIVGAFTALGLLFTTQVWMDYAYAGRPLTWSRATAVALAGWYFWALLTPVVLFLGRRFRFDRRRWRGSLAVHLVASLVAALVGVVVGELAAQLITRIQRGPFSSIKLHINFLTYWIILGVAYSVEHYRMSRERELRATHLEAQLARAQVQALRMQLHPHFLFNTLNAVAALMREDVEEADRMISRLSDLLRFTLDTVDVAELPLRQELDFLQSYLEIEKARAGERLAVRMAIQPESLDVLVPTLILQPLVENAIRHGVHARPGQAVVELDARIEGATLTIEVRDDGPGPPTTLRTGHGLENARARLATMYGSAATLDLVARPQGGASARLVCPARRAAADSTHWAGT